MRMPSFRVDGRKALITGASRGIGLAAACALTQAGAQVVLAARTESDLQAAKQVVLEAAPDAQVALWTLDVTDSAAVRRGMIEYGPFHVVVNNAGTNRPALLSHLEDADLDDVIDLNVKAAFYVTREAARLMQENSLRGSVINMSSQMGHVGGPKRTVYCATKHAIEGFSKALALELGPAAIRVNTICPTFIETEMTKTMLNDPAFKQYVDSNIALGRMASLEDIMGAVVFLASDASAMITGSSIMVDGGWTAS
ncbi:SDR family NAD(P)-dependent oxidoreductase [Allopusillimonas ginsengisoli]|uniref:SDR family NAD(P)-dependent oxidoreductase n=1 Tax=Allopusillimonas ginsengisoli TaxID=453575 RepID=UPI00101E9EC5|nr:SDR family NAD(P)-dependent oxidoreductase [Allopusillimonas ginsengisoli]TEA79976.1 SDR family oxidoreductase [Allopusillimonas ginsengisoli]